ncbi:MAG: DUF4124 domain-containing protein [Gammaproteobacteria bacterium]|nr:DUF4124 domain-containing protein [Gammaproteobacteria bacterium]
MRQYLLIVLCLFFTSSYAELYKWIDETGETVYSDEPPNDKAEPLVPPPISTTPAVKYTPKAKPEIEEELKETSYSVFKIASPTTNQILEDNTGNITVNFKISPALDIKQGHTISLLLDNQKKIEGGTSSSLVLKNIDRGTHSLQALIKNKQRKTLKKSQVVTIHMRRISALHKKAP